MQNQSEAKNEINSSGIAPSIPKKRWYYPTWQQSIALFENAKRDFVWPIITTLGLDYALNRAPATEGFNWAQNWGQALWSSLAVYVTSPFTVIVCVKYAEQSIRNCAMTTFIADTATNGVIFPWNGMQYVGNSFFLWLGFENTTATYLSGIFPGPGLAEGPGQTLITNALSYQFDPTFEFNRVEFILGLSPLSFFAGDTWEDAYAALLAWNQSLDMELDSAGALIMQGIGVMLAVLTLNYLTMKAFNAISSACKKKPSATASANRETEEIAMTSIIAAPMTQTDIRVARRSGSPIHVLVKEKNTTHDDEEKNRVSNAFVRV